MSQDEELLIATFGADAKNSLFSIKGSFEGQEEEEIVDNREQFIGVMVGKEEFLLPIATVSEIVVLRPITYVPNGPQYVEGVFNIRGAILPAINLARILGQARAEPTPASRIVVVMVNGNKVGMLVDSITYVVALQPNEIENTSVNTNHAGADLISRLSKRENRVNGIFDISKVVTIASGGTVGTPEATPDETTAAA